MYSYGAKSLQRLSECHEDLQKIMHRLIETSGDDYTILCGRRTEYDQNKAYNSGTSQLQYPHSKHNKTPSLAVDVAPYPLKWGDIEAFELMCDRIEAIAEELGIKVRMGRDFSFKDYPHVELM